MSRSRVYAIISGDTANPSLETLRDLASALGVTIADLLDSERTVPAEEIVAIPEKLREYAALKRREDDPLDDETLQSLARIQYRGQTPGSTEDWRLVHQFLKRVIECD